MNLKETITLAGIGVRAPYFKELAENRFPVGFLEAHSENYFGNSLSREYLNLIGQQYPLSLHGVGLSLGRADGLDRQHLHQLKHLIDELNPILVSEHLAWSSYQHRHVPDLLPVPYVQESLQVFTDHVEEMQQALGRRILVENPSNYLAFRQTNIHEADFLQLLAERTNCQILLDVNNLYISSINVGVDPEDYISRIDPAHIGQFHLAGHIESRQGGDRVLIDSHNQKVADPVWQLFQHCLNVIGSRPALIEWDSDYPELDVLIGEANRASMLLNDSSAVTQPQAAATEARV